MSVLIATRSFRRNSHPLRLRTPSYQYPACGITKRFRSTIFFSDEKGSAEENVYFKKEDELLLKNLLSNHPEFNPKYSTASLEQEVGTLARDLHLVCKKHGVANVSLAFIRDIHTVFEMHGWKKGGETAGSPLRSSKSDLSSSLRP